MIYLWSAAWNNFTDESIVHFIERDNKGIYYMYVYIEVKWEWLLTFVQGLYWKISVLSINAESCQNVL